MSGKAPVRGQYARRSQRGALTRSVSRGRQRSPTMAAFSDPEDSSSGSPTSKRTRTNDTTTMDVDNASVPIAPVLQPAASTIESTSGSLNSISLPSSSASVVSPTAEAQPIPPIETGMDSTGAPSDLQNSPINSQQRGDHPDQANLDTTMAVDPPESSTVNPPRDTLVFSTTHHVTRKTAWAPISTLRLFPFHWRS